MPQTRPCRERNHRYLVLTVIWFLTLRRRKLKTKYFLLFGILSTCYNPSRKRSSNQRKTTAFGFRVDGKQFEILVKELFANDGVTIIKAWFKRRILHAPNQILILVDSNEYIRLIALFCRIKLLSASDVF